MRMVMSRWQRKGFTLIELVVVMAILLSVILLAITNYQQSQQSNTLKLGVQQLVADLNSARSLTLNGRNADGCTPSPLYNTRCREYGVHVDPDTGDYLIFIDGPTSTNHTYDGSAVDQVIRRAKLPIGVTFGSMVQSDIGFSYISDADIAAGGAGQVIDVRLWDIGVCNGNTQGEVPITISRSGNTPMTVTLDCASGKISSIN